MWLGTHAGQKRVYLMGIVKTVLEEKQKCFYKSPHRKIQRSVKYMSDKF